MLKPWAKNSASPATRFGSMASAYSLRWAGSGHQHHDQVGLLARLVGREHPQALGLRLGPAAAALRQTDTYVDPGVAQRQGVGVTLAAEAQDGDVAPWISDRSASES
jgi:hypothetical protein